VAARQHRLTHCTTSIHLNTHSLNQQEEFNYYRRGRVGEEGEVLRIDGSTLAHDRSKLIAVFNKQDSRSRVSGSVV